MFINASKCHLVSICLLNQKFIIIYRPPKYSPAFVEELTELLSMISSEFDCFAIAGDFNIHIDNAEIKTTK